MVNELKNSILPPPPLPKPLFKTAVKKFIWLATISIVILILLGLFIFKFFNLRLEADKSQKEKENLSKELSDLKNEKDSLEQKLNRLEQFIDETVDKTMDETTFPCIKDPNFCKAGSKVLVKWQGNYWYPAKINSETNEGYEIVFYNGNMAFASKYEIREFDWKIGTYVECNWKNWGTYYRGTITFIDSKGESIHISYDDGDQEDATISRCRSL